MQKLAAHLRLIQLFAHNCHNLVSGATFLADHPFLGEIYTAAEADYDDVVERMIGTGMTPDLLAIQTNAVIRLKKLPSQMEATEMFRQIYALDEELKAMIEAEVQAAKSEGTRQMLGNIADKAEVRCYKLKQRIGKQEAKAEEEKDFSFRNLLQK